MNNTHIKYIPTEEDLFVDIPQCRHHKCIHPQPQITKRGYAICSPCWYHLKLISLVIKQPF